MSRLEAFASRDLVAEAAARIVAQALEGDGARTFVATGGTTPGPAYDRLARLDLNWASVTVTLTDERFVDPASDESNERLVRSRLLSDRAAAARFLPLKGWGASPQEAAAAAEPALRALLPSACVLLGMGPDGHVASLFPGAAHLAEHLDSRRASLCVGIDEAGVAPFVPRISLTAAALLSTATIVILITGAEKRAVVERVASDTHYTPPVATLLRQDSVPVRLVWAP